MKEYEDLILELNIILNHLPAKIFDARSGNVIECRDTLENAIKLVLYYSEHDNNNLSN